MRKAILLILLLCLCIVMSSCGVNNNSDIQNSSRQENIEPTSKDNFMPDDRRRWTIGSIEMYQRVISAGKLPDDFVRFEEISQLGDFKYLVFLSDTFSGDFTSYMYTLVNASGYEIVLYVEESKDEDIQLKDNVTGINSSDMRFLNDKSSGIYKIDGVEYKYRSGRLVSIVWRSEGVTYRISSEFSSYPNTTSTFVSKLLNLQTASVSLSNIFGVASD